MKMRNSVRTAVDMLILLSTTVAWQARSAEPERGGATMMLPVSYAADEPSLGPVPDLAGSSAFPTSTGSNSNAPTDKRWVVISQTTFTVMGTSDFRDPAPGAQTLVPNDIRETFDASLYLGARPWNGGEIWATTEVDQGFGVGNAHGIAGYPSGEAYKLGKAKPYTRLQRLYLRQTFTLGGASTHVDAAANQMAGMQSTDRLVITFGKISVVDIFDTNKYAHDPRGDFLNWSVIDSGAFDYAGDPWGYTYGAAAELYWHKWTLRAGAFNLTDVPGGLTTTTDFSFLNLVGELEHRHRVLGHPGAIRAALWMNHGRLGLYSDAIAWGLANARAPDVSQVENATHTRIGGYFNAEQGLTGSLGVFMRASIADGRYAAFDFTDIDRSISAGLSLVGEEWKRPDDTLLVALVANGASAQLKSYLAAGGLGLLIGDNSLPHPGTEAIVEASYTLRPIKPLAITFDAQCVTNPAFNRDRGPVALWALRIHGQF